MNQRKPLCRRKIVHIVSPFLKNQLAIKSEKIKRDFGPEKYTFARFKCSPVDQTRRRKAGIGSSLPGILPGLCHETYLSKILITHEAFTIPFRPSP